MFLPEYVKEALDALESNGFEGYVVGGAVRDSLMGKIPEDWDITTNAHTSDVGKIFKKHFDTGLKHGTVTVLLDGNTIEITTYRVDGLYEDNRRPKNVIFTSELSEDLKRRDFTINAMAYNPVKGIVDLFGGKRDIEDQIIRCVGNPYQRFKEDALRIMRAARFASRLGFEIEEDTKKAIRAQCHLLNNISSERINTELTATLLTHRGAESLFSTGIMRVIIPEIQPNAFTNKVECKKDLRYSALLYGLDTKTASSILGRLKFDNKTRRGVLSILNCCYEKLPKTQYELRKLANKYDWETVRKALSLRMAQGEDVKDIISMLDIVKFHPCKTNQLALDGNDVIKSGYTGKQVKEVMNYLMDIVLKEPKNNKREILLEKIKYFNQ